MSDRTHWGTVVGSMVVPTFIGTVFGAGLGAAMSLIAKPQHRGVIVGTGAAFGALASVAIAGPTALAGAKTTDDSSKQLRFP